MAKKAGWIPSDEELKFIDQCREAGDTLEIVTKKLKKELGLITTPSTLSRKISKYSERLVNKPKPKFPPEYYFILRYKDKKSIEEVALLTQRTIGTVRYHLQNKELQEKYKAYEVYKDNKSSVWEYKQSQLINKLDDDMIKNMSSKEIVNAAVKMEAPIRVMRGEATTIIGMEGFDRELAELDEEERRLRKAIDVTPEKVEEFEGEDELRKLERDIKLLEGK